MDQAPKELMRAFSREITGSASSKLRLSWLTLVEMLVEELFEVLDCAEAGAPPTIPLRLGSLTP